MVEKNRANEHAFRRIQKDIKEARIKNTVILYGKEQYLVNWALGMLIERYINPVTKDMDISYFDSSSDLADDVVAACETIAMLSEKRVVVLKTGNDKFKMDGNAISEYIEDVPSETLLILTFENEDRGKDIIDAAKGYASIYDFDTLDDRALKAFIGKRLKNNGKNIEPAALRELLDTGGYFNKDSDYTLYNLINDIEKLSAYADGDIITRDDVEDVVGRTMEKNIFAITDAVSRGRKGEAIRILSDLLTSGESLFTLFGLIVSNIEVMLSAKQLKSQGMNYKEISSKMGVHEYRVKKALPVADRYGEDNLKKILIDAYEVENRIKSGVLDDRTALELFIASM